MKLPPIEVLLVEDNPADARWFTIVLGDLGLPHNVRHVVDGDEAIRLLQAGEMVPMLILLDMNLPRVDGIVVLERIRAIPALANVPTCMLTGSSQERDSVQKRFGLDLRCYLEKPITPESLLAALASFESLRQYVP